MSSQVKAKSKKSVGSCSGQDSYRSCSAVMFRSFINMKKLISIVVPFVLFAFICFGVEPYNQYGLPSAITVLKSDTTTYRPPLRAVFFSATAAQTLTVDMAGSGTGILLTFGAAGTYFLPISVTKIYSSGTTVTGIVGFREYVATQEQPTPTATATATFTPTPTP